MNRGQLIGFLEHPHLLRGESLPVLQDLVKQFPYCQTAHLLLVKCLQNDGNISYNDQLKTAAAFASDRTVLHKLLEGAGEGGETDSLKTRVLAAPPTVLEDNAEKVQEKTPVLVPVNNPVKLQILSPREILEERLREIEELKNKAIPPETKAAEVRATSVPAEIQKEPADPEKNITASVTEDVNPDATGFGIKNAPAQQEEKPLESGNNKADFRTFSDWLKLKANEKKGKSAKKSSRGKEQLEMIDRFISKEPKISPSKTEFFNPANMAKLSVEESYDYVSETLAKIYFDQGNYHKALTVYEKLSLQFPEKSAIFAAQIKAIQQILNEK